MQRDVRCCVEPETAACTNSRTEWENQTWLEHYGDTSSEEATGSVQALCSYMDPCD